MSETSKSIDLWLVTGKEDGPLDFEKVGVAGSRKAAMAMAKRLAGKGAKFVRHGQDIGYVGSRGTVWLGEPPK